jgi:hypothetical protein
MRERNDSVADRISDHPPVTADLPLMEPTEREGQPFSHLPLDLGAAIFHFSVIKLFRNQLANRALEAYSQSRPCLRLKRENI